MPSKTTLHPSYPRTMEAPGQTLYQEVIPTGKNGQRLVNFLKEAKDHYEQVKAFYGYNSNMLNTM